MNSFNIKLTALCFKVILILNSFFSNAQVIQKDNTVGTNHFIKSEVLDQERQIQVYLPEQYEESGKSYPVLYILDGQRFFLYGVNVNQTFHQFKLTPDFILVGINNRYPQRFGHFSNGKENFIKFISDELIPYVESRYRTTNERLLFGWEYAGSLGFNVFLNDPSPFAGYFLASPFPIKNSVPALADVSTLNKSLYFSVSPNEFTVNQGVDRLDSMLSYKDIAGLDWAYLRLANEEHRSTGYSTLYHGLRKYFKYYPELQVDNFEKFLDEGGLEYVYNYNKERSHKHGFPPELSTWTKFTIIRSAMRADNFEYFNSFCESLNLMEFVTELAPTRAFNVAVYYEENGSYQKAIDIYKILLAKNPDSERILNSLGRSYEALQNTKESQMYFKKAAKVSKGKE